MFSLPINPFLSPVDLQEIYIPFVKKHRELITDLYFTCRLPPFTQDSMGALIESGEDERKLIIQALLIQKETGVPVNAVFNSLIVSPSLENLRLFVQGFQELYEAGIHRMTMVETHWGSTLKKTFPECHIKKSIIHPVTNAQNFVDHALLGFDGVVVDRNLMRNRTELLEIRKARNFLRDRHGLNVEIIMLGNEKCRGHCPVQLEHHIYNASRRDRSQETYMTSKLCDEISCNHWRNFDPAYELKTCELPPWKASWDEMLEFADSIKLHGRDDMSTLNSSMNILKNFSAGKSVLDEEKLQFFERYDIVGETKERWLEKISNCRNQCWSCNYCDTLISLKAKQNGKSNGIIKASYK